LPTLDCATCPHQYQSPHFCLFVGESLAVLRLDIPNSIAVSIYSLADDHAVLHAALHRYEPHLSSLCACLKTFQLRQSTLATSQLPAALPALLWTIQLWRSSARRATPDGSADRTLALVMCAASACSSLKTRWTRLFPGCDVRCACAALQSENFISRAPQHDSNN